MTEKRDRPEDHNISTDHQREGDARRPSDTLDRPQRQDTDHTETQPAPNISTEN